MKDVDEMASRIANGLRSAWARNRTVSRERHRILSEQAAKFHLGQRVQVIRDHDGLDGRWVGVIAETIEFDWSSLEYPWRIRAPSGAEMYAASDMIAPH